MNGSLPDVCVLDTTLADWQAVIDLVRSAGWACCEYSEDGGVVCVPGRVEDMLGRRGEADVMLKVWLVPGGSGDLSALCGRAD
jgi:hypothetical protein